MLIAQITDTHVTEPGGAAIRGADTVARLADAVAHVLALTRQPDLVLFTGDLVDKGTAAEYAEFDRLVAPLAHLPIRMIPGNHDDRAAMLAAFGARGWAVENDGFLQDAMDLGPLRLLLLDTVDPGRVEGRLCPRRLAWIAERLDEAPDRPTVIAMHHPPFASGIVGLDRIGCTDGDALGRLAEGRDNVLAVLCGHMHRPVTRGWRGTLGFVAPSAARQFAADLRPDAPYSFSEDPPAIALHLFMAEESPHGALATHIETIGGRAGR